MYTGLEDVETERTVVDGLSERASVGGVGGVVESHDEEGRRELC